MKILFVKLSSLGDIVHSFPAVNDCAQNMPDIELHWLVEEGFADLAALPKFVKNTHKIHLRKLKKQPIKAWQHIRAVRKILKAENYDIVIDGQGLIKSGILAKNIAPDVYGYDKNSARDSNASYFYNHKINVSKEMHALERTRQLFAQSLGYSIEDKKFNYGIDATIYQPKGELILNQNHIHEPFVFLFHGTTWPTKHWPFDHWVELAELLKNNHLRALVTYGNDSEKERAEKLSQASDNFIILPKLPLMELMAVLSCAKAFVSVDTGLGHLAAALDLPGVAIYGPTSPDKVGILGTHQISLFGHKEGEPFYNKEYKQGFDSMANITAQQVYDKLLTWLGE
ncbi:MAG: lipopolysaccharide heptosyltransferase I [Alphaproteobacteria bacterium]